MKNPSPTIHSSPGSNKGGECFFRGGTASLNLARTFFHTRGVSKVRGGLAQPHNPTTP